MSGLNDRWQTIQALYPRLLTSHRGRRIRELLQDHTNILATFKTSGTEWLTLPGTAHASAIMDAMRAEYLSEAFHEEITSGDQKLASAMYDGNLPVFGRQSAPHDTLFELYAASLFKRAGLDVIRLNEGSGMTPDMRVTFEGHVFALEAKRLTSPAALPKALSKAMKQIEVARQPGLIILDVAYHHLLQSNLYIERNSQEAMMARYRELETLAKDLYNAAIQRLRNRPVAGLFMLYEVPLFLRDTASGFIMKQIFCKNTPYGLTSGLADARHRLANILTAHMMRPPAIPRFENPQIT